MPELFYMKKILAPWILVIIGIIFNLSAALITNYFISINNEQLGQLEVKVQQIETRINNYWQDKQNIERKMEFILLMQQQEKQTHDPFVAQYIETFIQQMMKQYQITAVKYKTLTSQKVIKIVRKTQEQIINDIDEIYFDKMTLEKEKIVLVGVNSKLMSIALFMQLLGLILILAKDFQRKP